MAGLAADDLIVSLYFLALYASVRGVPPDPAPAAAAATAGPPGAAQAQEQCPQPAPLQQAAGAAAGAAHGGGEDERRGVTVLEGATALALAAAICHAGTSIAAALKYRGGSITVITALTVALATAFPRLLAPLTASGEGLAAILMQVSAGYGVRAGGQEGALQRPRAVLSAGLHNASSPNFPPPSCVLRRQGSLPPHLSVAKLTPPAPPIARYVPPQLFFASVGASGDIRIVLATAPALFLWSFVAVAGHMALCLLFQRLWGYSSREMALASK